MFVSPDYLTKANKTKQVKLGFDMQHHMSTNMCDTFDIVHATSFNFVGKCPTFSHLNDVDLRVDLM